VEHWLPLENKTGDDFLMKSLPANLKQPRREIINHPTSESYVSLQGVYEDKFPH
jgi:hypothetical protein